MAVSRNLITQEDYHVPATLDDSEAILHFIQANKGKKVVVVQGLGFVGAVMSLVCANALGDEYAVIGVDLANEKSYWKIRSLNSGIFPLIADDPKIATFFENAVKKNNFYATYDPLAYQYADVIIIDINLDVQKESCEDGSVQSFDVDLTGFEASIRSVAQNCRDDVLILVETTVPPGTCQKVVKPIVDAELGMRGLPLTNYHLGHSYERVMPGPQYIDSIREFPRVYSGVDEVSADAVEKFLETIIDTTKCDLTRLAHTNATEMAKVLENSYRAVNIAFAVEWSRFAEEAGVNLYEIVDAIRERPTHKNLMYPGVGVGGYCLTKDPLLASWSRRSFFGAERALEASVHGVSTNDQMPMYAFGRLIEVFGDVRGKRVAFLGVSYRGDVGDTRFSPVEPLVKMTKMAGADVLLHDPFVSHWEELQTAVHQDIAEVIQWAPDLVVISAGHTDYKNAANIQSLNGLPSMQVFDSIGLLSNEQISMLRQKHAVSVLGRGDLD